MEPYKRAAGNLFGREDAIKSNSCACCYRSINELEFKNWAQSTIEEYKISGLCLGCQNLAFNENNKCSCDDPCCTADVGVGIISCGSQHCLVHGFASEEPRNLITEADFSPRDIT